MTMSILKVLLLVALYFFFNLISQTPLLLTARYINLSMQNVLLGLHSIPLANISTVFDNIEYCLLFITGTERQ
jgi:hypothetical protein